MDNNVLKHPSRGDGAVRQAGGPILCDLDGVLNAVEQGLLIIAPEVPRPQVAEMRREFIVMRHGLDAVKQAAGITEYCGSFHLQRDDGSQDGAA